MSPLFSRFGLRLLVPAFALSVLALFADPLPPKTETQHGTASTFEIAAHSASREFTVSLQHEADKLRQEADAAKKAARQTAAHMRWFLTLPAPSTRRCSAPTCAS